MQNEVAVFRDFFMGIIELEGTSVVHSVNSVTYIREI